MNKIQYIIITIFICTGNSMLPMDSEETAVNITAPTSNAGASSSTSTGAMKSLKSALKGASLEKREKKKLQYSPETKDFDMSTRKEIPYPSREEQALIKKEHETIVKEQIEFKKQEEEKLTENEVYDRLIHYAQTTLPEAEEIVQSCVQDLLEMWKIFSSAPTSVEDAQASMIRLQLHKQHYQNNTAFQCGEPILYGYASLLRKYKDDANYSLRPESNNIYVEKLDELLSSDLKKKIPQQAATEYVKAKEDHLNRLFGSISSNITALNQYNLAINKGMQFLIESEKILRSFTAKVQQYPMFKFDKSDYAFYEKLKSNVEKNMIINRIMPYARVFNVDRLTVESFLIDQDNI